ncbi:MAG: aspartate aminotransferase family protein [Candidatus Hydrogenedentota bacterium]|nr:MAG: aspartate aminotransferase family protein [Candidatus Hydrogenedentota bacterium]
MFTTAELNARLREVESRNLTYVGDDFPIYWSRAKGARIWDHQGREYIDFSSAFGVATVGHAHSEVLEAVRAQAAALPHAMGDVHPPLVKLELLEALVRRLPPGGWRGILSLNGSDAVESALKTVKIASGLPGIVAFEGAYHGLGYGALSVTARSHFRGPFRDQLGIPVFRLPFPEEGEPEGERKMFEVLRRMREIFEEEPVGGVIIEPIQGRGGIRVPQPKFLAALCRTARSQKKIVIFDEIMTGLGRTGRLFRFEEEGCVPDLLCLGKTLGGGFPISVMLGRSEIMDRWPETEGEAIHTSTFTGHPIGCAAGLAVMELLERKKLPQRAMRIERRVRSALGRWKVVGRGALLGVRLREKGAAVAVARRALERGLIVMVEGDEADVVGILPPLTIPFRLLEAGLCILREVLPA